MPSQKSRQSKDDKITLSQYSGPLPPSDEFQNYEEVLPGAADRIISMAEKEQEGRISAQHKEMRMLFISHIMGQIFAFILGLTGILGGSYLIINGHDLSGFAVFLSSLAAIVGAFIYRKKTVK